MSSQNFRDEEIKFLREQHEKATQALQELEKKIANVDGETRDRLLLREGVC